METWTMKTKNWLLLTGLALSGLVWNGCYTQIARPDREEDTQVARESEREAEPAAEAANQYEEQYSERDDDRHVTNVYIYDDWSWRRPYWAYSPWYGYRYPYSRFYVSVGFGYYDPFDPWGWCGTPWNWYGPRDYYYTGYWNPYYYSGWRYHDPYYYPGHNYQGRAVEQRKRSATRRGATPGDDNAGGGGSYVSGGSRGSLARPVSGTYTRGDDGTYRRVRRTDSGGTLDRRGEGTSVGDQNTSSNRDNTGRAVRRTTNDGGDKTISRRPTNSGNSSGNSRGSERRGRRDDGGSVSRPGSSGSSGSGSGSVSRPSGSGSSGRSSPPPSSGSSGSSGSSDRRKRN
ncbi:MAG: hypothetical protein ALAOOOJD_01084 [bacterium]|nr:hypothetical protein [bacterium]